MDETKTFTWKKKCIGSTINSQDVNLDFLNAICEKMKIQNPYIVITISETPVSKCKKSKK
jgi:hypothetical protein